MATDAKVRLIELRAEGLSYATIAEALNISKQVATDKLINLFIKTTQTLKEEVYIPEAKSSSEQTKEAQQRSLDNWAGW